MSKKKISDLPPLTEAELSPQDFFPVVDADASKTKSFSIEELDKRYPSLANLVVDEDDMISNTDQKVPTQQSVKAYVDAGIGGFDSRVSNLESEVGEAVGGNDSLLDAITAIALDQEYDTGNLKNGSVTEAKLSPALMAGGRLLAVHVFDTAGSHTYNKNPDARYIEVEVVGGGGGSGGSATGGNGNGSAGGGGGGGYSRKFILNSSVGDTETVEVGSGGDGGAAGNNDGSSGGSSSFGSHLSATGGGGGTGSSISTGGLHNVGGEGGVGSGGDLNLVGGTGGTGRVISGTFMPSGVGGQTFYAPQRRAITTLTSVGGHFPGGGAMGARSIANDSDRAGAVGADGIVIVREYA